ncbi:MAG: hypothetical protein AB7T59_15280 [Hyphomonadaceae bacterium]
MWDWFFEPFADQTWWDVLNSSIVATTLSAAVGIFVASRVGQVAAESKVASEQAARTRHAIERDQDEADAEAAATAAAGVDVDPQHQTQAKATFHRAASAIRSLKDYVDARADRVRDGRVRRKYNNISRRDYRVLITALGADGGLAEEQRKELMEAFDRWRSFRTGRQTVSERVAAEYETLATKYQVTPTKPPKWRPDRARMIEW